MQNAMIVQHAGEKGYSYMHEYELVEMVNSKVAPKKNLKKRKAPVSLHDLETNAKEKLLAEPSASLDRLLVTNVAPKDSVEWAGQVSYNGLVKDHSRIVCYVCGGAGHFYQECGLHKSLIEKVKNNPERLRKVKSIIAELYAGA